MSIFEYDQEKHMRQEREAAWKAGMEEGMRSGIEKGRRSGIKEGISQGKEEFLKTLIQRKLAKNKSIAEIAAELEETEEHIRQVITRMSD